MRKIDLALLGIVGHGLFRPQSRRGPQSEGSDPDRRRITDLTLTGRSPRQRDIQLLLDTVDISKQPKLDSDCRLWWRKHRQLVAHEFRLPRQVRCLKLIDIIEERPPETWPYFPKGVSNAITTNNCGDADR